jgi:hypothetical protein
MVHSVGQSRADHNQSQSATQRKAQQSGKGWKAKAFLPFDRVGDPDFSTRPGQLWHAPEADWL